MKAKLASEVKSIFESRWQVGQTESVPDPEDLKLNTNHSKHLEKATVLYADIDGSTDMVDDYDWTFSAEVYKAYMRCSAEIVKSEGGVITAYDGDRIMAIFTGNTKNNSATRAAMKINYAVINIIQPALEKQYPKCSFTLKHVIGIDESELHAARIGVRIDNDLVWVGRAANYAAKLTSLNGGPIWITKVVYDRLNQDLKYSNNKHMWELRSWTQMDNLSVYRTSYSWRID